MFKMESKYCISSTNNKQVRRALIKHSWIVRAIFVILCFTQHWFNKIYDKLFLTREESWGLLYVHNENLKSSRYNEIFLAQSFLKLLTEVTHTQQNPHDMCTTQYIFTICPSNQHPNEQTSRAPLPPPPVTTLHPRNNHTVTSLCTLSLWTLAGGNTEPRGSPHQSHQHWPAHYLLLER